MKKALIVLAAIAILGVLGGYVLLGKDSNSQTPPSSNPVSAQNQARDRSTPANAYPNGRYIGGIAETLYGNVQIAIVIGDGRINDVQFLQMPDIDDGRSRQITESAKPQLKATTLDKQSDKIDFVTGATSTSFGYQESLQAALDKAYQASQN